MAMSGSIRFVGGPLHNRHIDIRDWAQPIRYMVPAPMSFAVVPPNEPAVMEKREIVEYRCRRMRSPVGGVYFEYRLA